MKQFLILGLIMILSLTVLASSAEDAFAAAVRGNAGFTSNTLAPNDDGFTGLVGLGFTIDFFGQMFSSTYVNNNGNITFDNPLSTFTPFDLLSTNRVIMAPFFADVDTRQAPGDGSSAVTYGTDTVNGRPAFGVNWINVDCYGLGSSPTGFNDFQIVLIDRSDTGPGNFDIEFNIDTIMWESGQASGSDPQCTGGASARVGFSDGSTNSLELPGSGVPGAFLDSGPAATSLIQNSQNNQNVLGRYVFEVREGIPEGQMMGSLIGGEVIPTATTSLLLAGIQSSSWLIPVSLSIIGIGVIIIIRR